MVQAYTCTIEPPKPMPSKNWWKLRAPTRGLMVDDLTDAPKDTPIITECTKIPSSRTCMMWNLLCYFERRTVWKIRFLGGEEHYNLKHKLTPSQYVSFFSPQYLILHQYVMWSSKTRCNILIWENLLMYLYAFCTLELMGIYISTAQFNIILIGANSVNCCIILIDYVAYSWKK